MVSSIVVTQNNLIGNCILLSVHNALVFLIDVAYTSYVPENLFCELQDEEGTVLNTFTAIPYKDSLSISKRTYAFFASDVVKAYMDDFEDFVSPVGTLDIVENITKQFSIRFYIDEIETTESFVAMHANRQFGQSPCLESININTPEKYYTGLGMPCYIYIYNNDENNVITIGAPTSDDIVATDYDDVVFVDSDDLYFKIL